MSEPAKKNRTYEDLHAIPENMLGEIINGKLVVTPRPGRKHGYVATTLIEQVGPAYHGGRGGPGGWIFIVEPEIILGKHIMVPDVAGWKSGRFPREEETNPISAVPDWVCEILSSPKGELCDRSEKMPIYARYGIPHAWLINPTIQSLEAYRLEHGRWSTLGVFGERQRAPIEPFAEIELDLGEFWLE